MLARLIALLTTGEVEVVKRRMKTAAIAYAAVAIAALFAVIFLVLAAYLAAAVRWGAIQSAVTFGLLFLVLSGIIFVIYRMVAAAQRRAQQHRRAADASMVAGASAISMLPVILNRKGGVALLIAGLAAAAGYAAYRELWPGSRKKPED